VTEKEFGPPIANKEAKMLILRTKGGLCNRMRAISSAFFLSREAHRRLLVEWSPNDELNCPFYALFEHHDRFIVERRLSDNAGYFFHSVLTRARLLQKVTVTNEAIYAKREEGWKQEDFRKYFLGLLKTGTLVIETDWNFYPSSPDNFSMLKPVEELQGKIESVTRHFPHDVIGVHIRRADHQTAIEESPLELFELSIQNEKTRNPSFRFFLSTDSLPIQQRLAAKWGTDCITFSRDKSRSNEAGVKEALVDLYCLAATKKILGSYWSSFSETAAALHNTPLQIIRRNQIASDDNG
jgi:hypothetical protein